MAKETIARYEIQSEIGRGGMAAVYLAYDPNFRRNVAIKLISGNLQENLVFRERFEREAYLIAKIEHPAIVPVYDYGEQDNQLYLVMRYMAGGALTNKIKAGVLTLGHSTQIISQVAPALDAVHSEGIVHRDLKPANILLDNFGNPAISDFGIAHLTVATTDLTGSAVIGTPSYMSPEQVRGDADLDGRSDVYALGVILFEMLTGHGPFQANTPMSVALKHLTDPLPSIRSFRPDLPIELEPILNKALAKDRKMRHASALELALELQAISDTFLDNRTPSSSIPIIRPQGEEIATEMDMDEDSRSAVRSFNVSERDFSQSRPQSSESINRSSTQTTTPKWSPRRILLIAATAGLGLFLFFLCGSVGVFGTWAKFGLPGLFPNQSQTPSPTPSVLFADDFSDPTSGWPTIQNVEGGYGYRPDGYHIFVNEIDAVFWAKTNRDDDNASIYVSAHPITENMNGYYGLLCRIQDDQNFYYFVVQSNGAYTIGKYKNAEFLPFFDWIQSDVVNQGDQTNRLRADCTGSRLRLYVNNVLLGEATDADFDFGFSGIVAASLDAQGFEVIFSNFLITEPGQ